MKKASIILVPLVALTLGGLLIAARFDATVQPNCYLGPFAVGNLTDRQVLGQLKSWWQAKRAQEVTLSLGQKELKLPVSDTGIQPDFDASIAQLPKTDVLYDAQKAVGSSTAVQHFHIRFVSAGAPDPRILVLAHQSASLKPARVYYIAGKFDRIPEQGATALNQQQFFRELPDVLQSGATGLELPVVGQTRITPRDLSRIDSVVSTFTTRFPVRKKDRNVNIKLAAEKIDGLVLMPGDRFSFNAVVGKRTIQDGFKEAPVFVNGGHGMGVGGGICQVSSTLYNAALFADLKVIQRHNHSLPVAYVPLGRDATVDYGSLDLVLQNNQKNPIALAAEYEPGRLTFRILGQKDPTLKVKIETSGEKSGDLSVKTIQDPKLPAGTKKVVDKGSRPRSILTYRLVYRDGKQIARDLLSRSYYRGGQRIVAVGPSVSPQPMISPANSLAANQRTNDMPVQRR